ncbi:MAG: DUF2062 domain-containing protein [Victivallaceae bacterium]|nr:DUF2062 domain-containing protein [Victivallaceae bacterium]
MKRWWIRKLARLRGKILREKASPEYIARGWALGMFCGCLLPFGGQLIVSIPMSFLIKGSKVGAVVGTLITNHFSIFIIYPAQCYVGNLLLGGDLSYGRITDEIHRVIELAENNGAVAAFKALIALGWDFAAPFFIGGALLTLIMTPPTYFFVLHLVRGYRRKRAARMKRKSAAASV